jgi:dUTP pyrophosphatase
MTKENSKHAQPLANIEPPTLEHPYFKVNEDIQVMRLPEFPNAVIPTRAHADDSGFDITPIRVIEEMQVRSDTFYLGTGLVIRPPTGFYLDMGGRSSISKTPVHLANAVGFMEHSYRGEWILAVTVKAGVDLDNFDPQELITGKAMVQGVLRPLIIAGIRTVTAMDKTERGAGGFGHTDDKFENVEEETPAE